MSDDVKIFEGSQIRSVWDNEREEWYFSIVDVVGSLTESNNPRDYWYRVKKRMSEEERSELSTFCRQLKLKSTDGKSYKTDVADMQDIFRIIQSVPSPKAEPFKRLYNKCWGDTTTVSLPTLFFCKKISI